MDIMTTVKEFKVHSENVTNIEKRLSEIEAIIKDKKPLFSSDINDGI